MKRFIFSFTICFIFCTALLLSMSCGKSDKTYSVKIKDGVKYVHNKAPLWGDTLKVALEFVQKIGGMYATDENYQFYRPQDLIIDKEGNIYLLDMLDTRIQKFDKNGKYLRTIGRQGQGPGEFMAPVCMEMDSEGNLYISDISHYRILVLTNDGKEIKRIQLEPENFILTHAGNILTSTDPGRRLQSENIARDLRLICSYDTDGNLIKEFGKYKDYGDENLTYTGNSFTLCVDLNDNIYVAFEDQNRIEKYSSDGELIFKSDRPINFKLGVDEKKSITWSDNTFTARFYSVSDGIEVDHKKRIWVHSYKKQKEEGDKPVDYFEFEIFDNDGVLLGKFPPPQNFNFMRIFNDRLFLVDRKEEMCVYEYKIIEK